MRADMDTIDLLIRQIGGHSLPLSEELQKLSKDFKYDEILSLISACPDGGNEN